MVCKRHIREYCKHILDSTPCWYTCGYGELCSKLRCQITCCKECKNKIPDDNDLFSYGLFINQDDTISDLEGKLLTIADIENIIH